MLSLDITGRSQLRSSNSLRRASTKQRQTTGAQEQPSKLQKRPSTKQRQSAGAQEQPSNIQRRPSASKQRSPMSPKYPSTPQRGPSATKRRRSSIWPGEIPPRTPSKSVSPKEYLSALSDLLRFASSCMGQVNLPDMIWAFNRAHARNDRIAMRQLGTSMLATLDQVQDAYHEFCDTRGTFDEDEIWKMVMDLGDDGDRFWDVVDELGELIEIMEGDETEAFWKNLEEVAVRA